MPTICGPRSRADPVRFTRDPTATAGRSGIDASPRPASGGRNGALGRADMTAMPEPDAAYDRVLSAFGAMFAPDAYAMAAELVRVCATDGLVANLAWTPDSPFGRQRPIALRHLPPGTEGGPPIEAFGEPDRVREFFVGHPVDIKTTMDTVDVRSRSTRRCTRRPHWYLAGSPPVQRPSPPAAGHPCWQRWPTCSQPEATAAATGSC